MKKKKTPRGRKPLIVLDLEAMARRLNRLANEIDRVRSVYLSTPASKSRTR
jgi:hypothetical protein